MKYYYFINGFFKTEEHEGFLRFEYHSKNKITSLEKIHYIENLAISEFNLKSYTVLNYQFLRKVWF